MSDFFFFCGILLFLFVVWVYTGGPTHPISFSGPYITPVTNVDTVQEGYGGDISANNFTSGGSFWGSLSGGSSNSEAPAANRSSYAGKVRLGGGNQGATDVRQEYITVESESDASISISGWQLVSTKTGAHATIPKGVQMATYTGAGSIPVVLNQGDTAIINSGKSPTDDSFRENKCTAYLDTNGHFYPSLSFNCPSPVDELGLVYAGDARTYDKCLDFVSSLSSCRVPSTDAPAGTPTSCQNFVDNHLNYKGCVAEHRSDTDFNSNTWRVFLESSRELWRSSNDTIQLLDANGKVVDQYSY